MYKYASMPLNARHQHRPTSTAAAAAATKQQQREIEEESENSDATRFFKFILICLKWIYFRHGKNFYLLTKNKKKKQQQQRRKGESKNKNLKNKKTKITAEGRKNDHEKYPPTNGMELFVENEFNNNYETKPTECRLYRDRIEGLCWIGGSSAKTSKLTKDKGLKITWSFGFPRPRAFAWKQPFSALSFVLLMKHISRANLEYTLWFRQFFKPKHLPSNPIRFEG